MGIIIERLASAGGSRPHGFRRLFSDNDAVVGEAALRSSGEMVDALDRSPLGTFAIDRKVLIAVQARERMDYEQMDKSSRAGWVVDDNMHWALQDVGQSLRSVEDYVPLRAEVMFWWSLLDPDKESIGQTVDIWLQKDPAVADAVERLRMVYQNPTKHDFYRAGVWDDSVISHCVEHGIDPSMAISLSYH